MKTRVAVLVGSLRKDSFTRKVTKAMATLAEGTMTFDFLEIGDLPLYNQDLETQTPPPPWVRFRSQLSSCDAILFATPEYNRSVPGVLKNAIDVGSRPREKSVFPGKPAAIISASTGALGGFGANHHLRQMLVFLDVPAMAQPEAYISHVVSLFDEQGRLTNDSTREFLAKFVSAFERFVGEHMGAMAFS